jgi:endonuclease YncB( thermonuclease family)
MSKRPVHNEDDGNVVHFDFRDELKIQRRKRRGKELILGLGAFSIVFAGGMLALNWPLAGIGASNSDQRASRPLALISAGNSPQFELCGMVRKTCVVDGDTFWLDGVKIRIADIDTPEISEPKCDSEYDLGMKATYRLRELLNEGPFELNSIGSRDEDRHGRKLRVVVRNGRSLGDQLVSEGLARTWSGRREPWC